MINVKAYQYCWSVGIKIYPEPTYSKVPLWTKGKDTSDERIVIQKQNTISYTPKKYNRDQIWEKIEDFYNYYYEQQLKK